MTALAPSILVFEDEPLIALDIEDMLTRAGYSDITIIHSCVAGKEYLQRHTPALAIFDIHLKDGVCTELAIILANRNVPFIVATGTDRKDADEVFVKAPWIAKPWYTDDFVAEVAKALNQTTFQKFRRPRGASALGDFEQSKREADLIIGSTRDAERRKTALLRALRLSRNNDNIE